MKLRPHAIAAAGPFSFDMCLILLANLSTILGCQNRTACGSGFFRLACTVDCYPGLFKLANAEDSYGGDKESAPKARCATTARR